jgi:hypothetical protein
MLSSWARENQSAYIRFEKNDSRLNRVWDELRSRNLEWVVFPGDDDIFLPSSINKFFKHLSLDPELVGLAFNLEVIDHKGKPTGEYRKPSLHANSPKHVQVASSIHEPPFLWPSFFINSKKIAQPLPTSRYIFDWWIGIQALFKGRVSVVDASAVQYRVHAGQESNISSMRRKYFEGLFWLDSIISSDEFNLWLADLSENDQIEFWNEVCRLGPIYGDSQFGFPITLRIAKLLTAESNSSEKIEKILGDLAQKQGVLLKRNELSYFCTDEQKTNFPFRSNVNVVFESEVCDTLRNLKASLQNELLPSNIRISCHHSANNRHNLFVDCNQLIGFNTSEAADIVLLVCMNHLESVGFFDLKITPNEKTILIKMRRFKYSLPVSIVRILHKIFLIKQGK